MKRLQITAINHYDVIPFNSGGSMAVLGLEKGLSVWFDVNLITFVSKVSYQDEIRLSDHLTLYPILVPKELLERQEAFYDEYGMGKDTIYDSSINVMRWYHEHPEIIARVRKIAADSALMIAEHVYTWKIIKTAYPEKPVFYRAHNVEYDYKMSTYKAIGSPRELLEETWHFEKACCEEAEHVLTVSRIESERFMELYGFPESMRTKFTDIHLGYDADGKNLVLPDRREKAGNEYQYYGFFISSDMPSALDAARVCIETARRYPLLGIIIAGRVGRLVEKEKDLPENVRITGLISDEEKFFYLSHCDFAMNPVESGAGVNVKMFEYYACGIPVVSTPYGARGTGLRNGIEGILADAVHYPEAVWEFCNMPVTEKVRLSGNAFLLLQREYSWRSIAERTAGIAERLLGIRYAKHEVNEWETKLYPFTPAEASLPKGEFYIRCAGNNGIKCLKFLRTKGLEPQAFVERDVSKIGSIVEGVRVISLEEYLSKGKDSEIVVAAWTWLGVTSGLAADGVPADRIFVSWGDTGHDLFHFSDMEGSIPQYCDPEKLRREVLDYAERLERRSHDIH